MFECNIKNLVPCFKLFYCFANVISIKLNNLQCHTNIMSFQIENLYLVVKFYKNTKSMDEITFPLVHFKLITFPREQWQQIPKINSDIFLYYFPLCRLNVFNSRFRNLLKHWNVIVYTHVFWNVIVYTYVFWNLIVYTHVFWNLIVYTHVFWNVIVYTHVFEM